MSPADPAAGEAAHVAAGWPEDVSAAVLVAPGEGDELPGGTLALMESLADRRRPAILVSVVPGVGLPDEDGEEAGAPGLTAVIRGEATLKEAARARGDLPFAFIAAGADGDPAALLESGALERLARAIRSAGGILLVHVPADLSAAPPGWLGGRVAAGGLAGDEGFAPGLSLLGRLRGARAAGGETAGRWRRHRKERGTPWPRIAAAAAGIAVIVAGWWLLAGESVEGDAGVGAPAADSPAAVSAAGSDADSAPGEPPPEAGVGEGAAAAAGAAGGDSRSRPAGAAPPGYSVLVASYREAGDAAARVERLRESLVIPVFATPTSVDGRLYHRVFAGARTDTAAAGALMRELVDRGLKRSASSWDLRPARYSLLVGRYPADSAARRALRDLGSAAVYAYVLPRVDEAGGRDTVHVLYAGAFEGASAAGELQTILREAGHETEVLIRRGEPR